MYVWICIRRMHKHRLGVREPNEEEMGTAEPDNQKPLPVAMRLRETPVPISNTTVKPQAAEGTMLETAWESRWLPIIKEKSAGSAMRDKKHILIMND